MSILRQAHAANGCETSTSEEWCPALATTVGAAVLVATLCVAFGAGALLAILWGISTFIYCVPAILGCRKRNFVAILALNFFLSWTLLGWAGALVWALTKEPA